MITRRWNLGPLCWIKLNFINSNLSLWSTIITFAFIAISHCHLLHILVVISASKEHKHEQVQCGDGCKKPIKFVQASLLKHYLCLTLIFLNYYIVWVNLKMTNTTLGFHQGEAEIEENPPRESSTYTHTHTHFTFYPIAFCYNNKKKWVIFILNLWFSHFPITRLIDK